MEVHYGGLHAILATTCLSAFSPMNLAISFPIKTSMHDAVASEVRMKMTVTENGSDVVACSTYISLNPLRNLQSSILSYFAILPSLDNTLAFQIMSISSDAKGIETEPCYPRASCCAIIPPHMLEHIANAADASDEVRESARASLE